MVQKTINIISVFRKSLVLLVAVVALGISWVFIKLIFDKTGKIDLVHNIGIQKVQACWDYPGSGSCGGDCGGGSCGGDCGGDCGECSCGASCACACGAGGDCGCSCGSCECADCACAGF